MAERAQRAAAAKVVADAAEAAEQMDIDRFVKSRVIEKLRNHTYEMRSKGFGGGKIASEPTARECFLAARTKFGEQWQAVLAEPTKFLAVRNKRKR
jgi:hypothetical protein